MGKEKLERNCLSLLKFSIPGKPVPESLIKAIDRETMGVLKDRGIIKENSDRTKVNVSRVKLALFLASMGGDLDEIVNSLTWQEFEDLIDQGFKVNGYETKKHFVFHLEDERCEIDILAKRKNHYFAVECKHWLHWRKMKASRLKKETSALLRKCYLLSFYLKMKGVEARYIFPLVVTAQKENVRVLGGIPLIHFLTLNNFLTNLDRYIHLLKVIEV